MRIKNSQIKPTTPNGQAIQCCPYNEKDNPRLGELIVIVTDQHTGSPISLSNVEVKNLRTTTSKNGHANFSNLEFGNYKVSVVKKFPNENYVEFYAHWANLTSRIREAVSKTEVSIQITSSEPTACKVHINSFRTLNHIKFFRKNIDLNGNDKYGHWWTQVGEKSYGWWPKQKIGSEINIPKPTLPAEPSIKQRIKYMADLAHYNAKTKIYSTSIGQTFFGVEGELNSKRFGGSRHRDPHHGDPYDIAFQPIINDGRSNEEISDSITNFVFGYNGKWQWAFEFGQNCHSFQIDLIKHTDLSKVKKL